MKQFIFILFVVIEAVSHAAPKWIPDILGHGIEMTYVHQPADYSGVERSTIIRSLCREHVDRGILYIHGFNDYFFQTQLALEFNAHGYDFFAVDLRKYGRSLLVGQTPFQVRDLGEYFADIDSALVEMRREGIHRIVLMGHSTGGLIAAYYMARNSGRVADVEALILNSPFLDWNLGKLEKFTGIVSKAGILFPSLKISQGNSTAYSESLLKYGHGEWTYNTAWKMRRSPDVEASWVNAIDEAQRYLRRHPRSIKVPVLVMCSTKSADADSWTPECQRADIVLDVNDIVKYGRTLAPNVTIARVPGGVHDLILSAPRVRNSVYAYMFKWLSAVNHTDGAHVVKAN